jgi:RNA polymerase sigma factor (TIGR02999 family)
MQNSSVSPSVTQLLQRWGNGDQQALDQLMPIVYKQLRKLAARALRGERSEHTLSPTALVHEAYLQLAKIDAPSQERVRFFAICARVVRNILVNHAKAHKRQKRGGDARRVKLDEALYVSPESSPQVLQLNEALVLLAVHDRRKSEIVELLFFGGMTYEETATALKISPATVHRELKMAKAWLHHQLSNSL